MEEIAVGQVWRDKDKRRPRRVVVIKLFQGVPSGEPYAIIKNMEMGGGPKVEVSLRRLRSRFERVEASQVPSPDPHQGQ